MDSQHTLKRLTYVSVTSYFTGSHEKATQLFRLYLINLLGVFLFRFVFSSLLLFVSSLLSVGFGRFSDTKEINYGSSGFVHSIKAAR